MSLADIPCLNAEFRPADWVRHQRLHLQIVSGAKPHKVTPITEYCFHSDQSSDQLNRRSEIYYFVVPDSPKSLHETKSKATSLQDAPMFLQPSMINGVAIRATRRRNSRLKIQVHSDTGDVTPRSTFHCIHCPDASPEVGGITPFRYFLHWMNSLAPRAH
jgi:hypothetical protein